MAAAAAAASTAICRYNACVAIVRIGISNSKFGSGQASLSHHRLFTSSRSKCHKVTVTPRLLALSATAFASTCTCIVFPFNSRPTALMERRKPRPPPRFTSTIPSLSRGARCVISKRNRSTQQQKAADELSVVASGKKDDKDCPVCRKYSKGPCGPLFVKWMDCQEANPGKDEQTGEDLHLSKCVELAEKLADCLAMNAEAYAGPIEYDSDAEKDADLSQGLEDAWLGVIAEVESSKRKIRPFPAECQAEMEARPSSGWGVASFAPLDRRGEPLIMAYLKNDKGDVLAAGSGEDLSGTGGFLRFLLADDTESITAYALYGGEDSDALFKRTCMLPPT